MPVPRAILPLVAAALFLITAVAAPLQAQTPLPASPARAQPSPQAASQAVPGTDAPAPAPSGFRARTRDELLTTVGLTCATPVGVSEADALRRCFLKARTRLVAKMSGRVSAMAGALGLTLTDEEIAAYTLQAMRVEADRQEIEAGPRGLTVHLTGRAVADLSDMDRKLPFYAENGDVRAAAVAQYRAAQAEARAASLPAAPPAEEQAEEIRREMRDTARFAERQLRLGMSQADVVGLLGEPGSWIKGAPDESFVCLGYGDVWAVFENGELACLRTRLEYSRRHESQCHCSGRLATILLGVEPR